MSNDNGPAVLEPEVIVPEAKRNQESIALRYSGEADADLALCQTVVVETAEQYQTSGELRLELDAKVKKSETARDALVRPLNDHVRWINSIFKPAQDKWRQGMGLLSSGRLAYERAQQAKAEAERRRLEEEARKEQERLNRLALERAARAEARGDVAKAEEILETVPQVPIPILTAPPVEKTKGIAKTTYWSAQVTNLAALVTAVAAGEVPMDAVTANLPWLNKTAAALKTAMKYPGVRVVSEERERSTGR